MSQWLEYAEKKGDHLCELAAEHLRCKEPQKAKELLSQAIGWYKKAGLDDKVDVVKQKLNDIG